MRNSKFVRYGVILLDLVVLRAKAQNGFCPMYTKRCHTVMNRSKPFWGQFWGRIGEINSYPHHSNKRAVLVPLRNADTYIAGFSQVKSPTNQYISFTLRQEVVRKHYSTPSPHTAPRRREKHACLGAFAVHRRSTRSAKYRPNFSAFQRFLFHRKGI